jgi:peroxisomal 3,2-trans-enoyl-CoA isomerase
MTYQCIETELRDGVLLLRHDREEKLNARCTQMYMEIMAALEDASANDAVIAVLLTGKGRFFSAGMDFNDEPHLAFEVLPTDSPSVRRIKTALPERDPADVRTWPAVKFIEAFIHFDKPLIGAVNGPAIGEGFSSLLHCDLVYAADTAYFWAPFARAGVAPEFCSTRLMPRRLGPGLANAALYLGRRISVDEAKAAGFVLEILPFGEGFEDAVLSSLNQGLALAGPPEVRTATLRSYKRLVHTDTERRLLVEQCRAEFELIRKRALSGETRLVQQYYRAQLPGS